MATRRMIASEIWQDEWLGRLDYFERILWIGLFCTCADDQGRLKDNPFLIRSSVFIYDTVEVEQIEQALTKFERDGRVLRYEIDGKKFMQIVKWWGHQRPQWAAQSKYPPPPNWADRVRTRQNGQYIEQNWRERAEEPDGDSGDSSPEHSGESSGESSPEETSRTVHLVGQYPVPDPVPVTDNQTDNSLIDRSARPDGRASPEAPAPTEPSRKCTTKAKDPPPPAVQVFHTNTQRYPAKALWPEIDAAIGRDPPELERWAQVIRAWLATGWNKGNVGGMLDFFKRGELPGNRNGGNHAGPRGPGPRTAGVDPDKAARTERRLEAIRRRTQSEPTPTEQPGGV